MLGCSGYKVEYLCFKVIECPLQCRIYEVFRGANKIRIV